MMAIDNLILFANVPAIRLIMFPIPNTLSKPPLLKIIEPSITLFSKTNPTSAVLKPFT